MEQHDKMLSPEEQYAQLAPTLDADGFSLYAAAEEATGLKVYEEFPYLEMSPPKSTDSLLFPSLNPRSNGGRYGNSWLQAQFRQLLRTAGIPYNGSGKGPRPHDIRHTFAVHCLNNWVLSGEDLTAALPVLSRYLGHNGLTGTQKYLQLTAQMYPDIVAKLEVQFGGLIPQMEVSNESI